MSKINPGLQSVPTMGDTQSQRLYSSLDAISDRLIGIENKLAEIVRLEERVKNHSHLLSKNTDRLDDHDRRLKTAELWLAKHSEGGTAEKLLIGMQEETSWIRRKLNELEASRVSIKVERDIGKEVLKWTAGILGAILAYIITGQGK